MLLAHSYSAYRLACAASRRRIGFTIAASISAIIASSSAFAASTLPLDPSGYWSTKDDESIIRISPCVTPAATTPAAATPPAPTPPAAAPAGTSSAPYCGTLVWLKEPLEKGVPKTDTENPDKEKRSRPLIGLELLTELSADKDHWKGKAYNADDGKIYDITFKVIPDKVKGDTGEITGCVLRILCMSETFTKVQSVPGGDPTLPAAAAHGATPAKTPTPSAHTH
jgi:uncharacterized protein (DUF2147 family)